MGMISEFREFAMKGNVIDLAVGVVIGASFGKIVSSLVDNIIMPPIGYLIGSVDFSDLAITLKEATTNAAGEAVPAVQIGIGTFINTVIQFLIVAFAIFIVVRAINRMRRTEPEPAPAPAEPSEDVLLLREIRDSLRQR